MQMLESSLNLLKGKALEQRYYNLAVRYAQASIKGDCWWLLHNTKSAYDKTGPNEADFGQKAVEYLQKAAVSKDKDLKLKALFAMGYQELYTATPNAKLWWERVWDEKNYEYVPQYNRQSPQFRAFQSVFDLVENKPGAPTYITKCDEFNQFRKYYRSHK